MILVENTNLHSNVVNGLLTGGNKLSQAKSKFLAMESTRIQFDQSEYKQIRDWSKFTQDEITEPIPFNIGISAEDMFVIVGHYMKGAGKPMDIPLFRVSNNDNMFSELLVQTILLLISGDVNSAYATFQTWMFFMSRLEYERTNEKSMQAHQDTESYAVTF